jgi:hypothetical protein
MRARALLLLFLIAGNASAQLDRELGQNQQAIVHGERSDDTDDVVLYVLARRGTPEGTACTGTLIAPNVVITALHCISNARLGEFSCNPDGTLVTQNPGDGSIGQLVPAEEVGVYRGVMPGAEPDALGKKLFGTATNQICRNDLGLIVLDRALDGAPISKIRLINPVRRGETVRVVGYGQTETSGTTGRFRRTGRAVVDVGPDSDADPVITAAPRTFVVGEGPCQGDSGGPAFAESTGALLGVFSLAAGTTCTATAVRNVYTRLGPFQPLLNEAFALAGAEPLEESGTTPEPSAKDDGGCALRAPGGYRRRFWLEAGAALLTAGVLSQRQRRQRERRLPPR